jgi:hypothetical protein
MVAMYRDAFFYKRAIPPGLKIQKVWQELLRLTTLKMRNDPMHVAKCIYALGIAAKILL